MRVGEAMLDPREFDFDDFFKWAFRLWFVWAVVALSGGVTLLYFVVQALNKYINS